MAGYIYLLRERQFIDAGQNIYKLGGSGSVLDACSDYKIIVMIMITDYESGVDVVRRVFENNFGVRADIGRGYFEGSPNSMVHIIFEKCCHGIIRFNWGPSDGVKSLKDARTSSHEDI